MLRLNGVEIHHEVRGDGPPLLMIMGMTGDAGHFETVAELLSDEFTVVTYDRRGNGRSPRPPDWATTSPEEQADDAAALLDALGLAPAAVYGSSSGGVFALCLVVRHPGAVRGVILHEPALVRLFDDPASRAAVTALADDARAAGGPAHAIERLWCHVSGEASWGQLAPALRNRIVATADTFLDVELGSYEQYLPDDATLAAIAVPAVVLVSDQSRPAYAQAAHRLAERLGVDVARTPGTHSAYDDHPHELVRTIRPFLREVFTAAA
jgi:pimeloyl-ACP methyl ester carboxylesterase